MYTRKAALLLGSGIATLAASGAVLAVDEEIIVTATRTGETFLQQTPIAASAFSAETLDAAGVSDVENIAQITPGFTFSTNGPWAISSSRGIGTNNVYAGGDPSVTVQVDGVYYARASSGNLDLIDVERVEVLRGPQGTLYGRNAIGGTINVITKDPDDEVRAKARFTGGNYSLLRGDLSLSGPIVRDRVYGSIAGRISKRDGYIEQLVPGVEDTFDEDRYFLRGKLKFLLNEDVSVTVAGDYFEQDEFLQFESVRLAQPFADGFTPGFFQAANDSQNVIEGERWGISAKAVWDISDSTTLTSLTAYRDSEAKLTADLDNSALFLFPTVYFPEIQDQFSQELTISAEAGNLTYVGGLFFFTEDAFSVFHNQFALASSYQANGIDNTTKSYAVFAEGTYDLTDRLSITMGIRYTNDEKSGTNVAGADFVDPVSGDIPAFPVDPSTPPVTQQQSPEIKLDFDAFTPKFVLDYQVNDDVFLYASVSRGFKSGGFNLITDTFTLPTVTPVPYNEEEVWAYEAGLKSSLAEGHARLNVTGFYYDYSGLQVTQIVSTGSFGQALFNAPAASVFGVEVEANARPNEYLELGGNISYLSSEYDGFLLVPDDPNPVSGTFVDADGNKTNDAPEWSGNIYASLSAPIGNVLVGSLRVDASYKDDVFYAASNNPIESGNSYWLLNIGVSVSTNDGRWTAGVRGQNLTDEEYLIRASTFVGVTGGRPGPPRTVLGYVELNF